MTKSTKFNKEKKKKASPNILGVFVASSASSSVIVSNTGKIGSLLGEMRRAGATSIQELKNLTPFAILV